MICKPWRGFIAMDRSVRCIFIDSLGTPLGSWGDYSTGMMDEKIYQRQITKQGLAESFMV
jgi:hypothetical protein